MPSAVPSTTAPPITARTGPPRPAARAVQSSRRLPDSPRLHLAEAAPQLRQERGEHARPSSTPAPAEPVQADPGDARWEGGDGEVQPNPEHDPAAGLDLAEDAGQLAGPGQHVVGPFQPAVDAGQPADRVGHCEARHQGDRGGDHPLPAQQQAGQQGGVRRRQPRRARSGLDRRSAPPPRSRSPRAPRPGPPRARRPGCWRCGPTRRSSNPGKTARPALLTRASAAALAGRLTEAGSRLSIGPSDP